MPCPGAFIDPRASAPSQDAARPAAETLPTVALPGTTPCPPTIAFPDAIKTFFQQWIDTRNNKALFNSAKRIRYWWILTVPEAPI